MSLSASGFMKMVFGVHWGFMQFFLEKVTVYAERFGLICILPHVKLFKV